MWFQKVTKKYHEKILTDYEKTHPACTYEDLIKEFEAPDDIVYNYILVEGKDYPVINETTITTETSFPKTTYITYLENGNYIQTAKSRH